jgi:hypothetical protein
MGNKTIPNMSIGYSAGAGSGGCMNKKSAIPKNPINPKHLVKAILNSLEHCDETAHAVTGLHFPNYTIIVRKRREFCWYIECKFKPVEIKQGRHIRRSRPH